MMDRSLVAAIAKLVGVVGLCGLFFRLYAGMFAELRLRQVAWPDSIWIYLTLIVIQIGCQWLSGRGLLYWISYAIMTLGAIVDYIGEWLLAGIITMNEELPRHVRKQIAIMRNQ